MAYAMADVVRLFTWEADDLVLLNDPYLGGTHLPDVTAISPLFVGDELLAFAACRAHHANIGADRPGSMPPLPAGFGEKYTKDTSTSDDPKAFATKAEVI